MVSSSSDFPLLLTFWYVLSMSNAVIYSNLMIYFSCKCCLFISCHIPARNLGSQDDRAECNQVHNILIEASWNHQLKLGLVHKQLTLLHCMWNPQSSCCLRSKNPYVVEKCCPLFPFLWEEITWILMFSILTIIPRSCTFAVVLQVSGSWFAPHAHGQQWRFSKVQSNLFTCCWICECHLLIHVDQICDVKHALHFWNGFSSKEYLHFFKHGRPSFNNWKQCFMEEAQLQSFCSATLKDLTSSPFLLT
jgi:hypothetical protein